MEYMVISRWTGWAGGWGSEGDLSEVINGQSSDGWKLVRTESGLFGWFWWFPRHKLLMIFERPAPPQTASP